MKPRPLCAANISLMTMRMTPIDNACRAPVTICGLAERRTKYHSRRQPRMRYERQVSDSTSSTARTPSTVLSRIGQTHPETMTSTFIRSPMPAKRMRIGTSTGGGMARRNSSTGSVAARSRRLLPMATPSATPRTSAAR